MSVSTVACACASCACRSAVSSCAITSPARTRSPSFTFTEAAASTSWLVIATFWSGAMTPEIDEVAWTVVARAAAVGTGFGDEAERARPPPPRCAQPATISASAADVRLTRSALALVGAHRRPFRVEVGALRRSQHAANLVHEAVETRAAQRRPDAHEHLCEARAPAGPVGASAGPLRGGGGREAERGVGEGGTAPQQRGGGEGDQRGDGEAAQRFHRRTP